MAEWPSIFRFLAKASGGSNQKDCYFADEIFTSSSAADFCALQELERLRLWLKELPSGGATRQACGTETLDENVVLQLEECVSAAAANAHVKEVVMQVRPHLLHKPNLVEGSTTPDDRARHFLFDRVINVREGFAVPLALKGTITGEPNRAGERPAQQDLFSLSLR